MFAAVVGRLQTLGYGMGVIKALGFHRSVIHEWPGRFRKGGGAALEAQPVPGRPSRLGPQEVQRLLRLIAGKNPWQLRCPFALWTRSMIQEGIWREFGVSLGESAVGRMWRRLGLSPPATAVPGLPAGSGSGAAVAGGGAPGHPEAGRAGTAAIHFGGEAGIRADHHREPPGRRPAGRRWDTPPGAASAGA